MKLSVLTGVALALATGSAGLSARAAGADPTANPTMLAIPAPPPPVPQTPIEHTPIPEAPAAEMMVAQAEAVRQPEPAGLSTASAREAPLDVDALKSRLRETNAIGLFTKIALKNQVDDLLEQFRTHHGNEQSSDVAALREPYDLLLLKVLVLIQDGDPALARTVAASRESIWNILADREKFNSAT